METLAKLFGSAARVKLLRLFLFNKEVPFTTAEIASRAKLDAAAVRRETTALIAAGFLKKRAGSQTRYQLNPKFEHFAALDSFIRETTIAHPELIVSALKKSGNLRLVALTGFFTSMSEPPVDLLIVGDTVNERLLSQAIHALEAEFGREIRYASFTTADFRYRLGVYDRLLRDVFDYPHRLLLDRIGL